MRRVFLDAGPMVHFANATSLSGQVLQNASEFIHDPGMGIVVEEDTIIQISESEILKEEYDSSTQDFDVISLGGSAIIPGLIDSHTHLLWEGDRSFEVSMKRNGLSYQEIAERGGGIGYTVNQTNQASAEQIYLTGKNRLKSSLLNGTTHLEAKSGYGLTTEAECRLLAIMNNLNNESELPSIDLTWMGAHAIPKNHNLKSYVEEILSEQLPSVLEQGYAKNADVFCEPGWFDLESTEDILKSASKGGLHKRLHIDEFEDGDGGKLASDLEVVTADHAYHTSEENRIKMNDNNVNAGFLPGTPFSQGEKEFPPFQHYINQNWKWTIATDFNPNCQTLSLPFIGSLLVQRNHIHPLAALAACTVHAADISPHPSGKGHGTIEKGSLANFNILKNDNWESWCLTPGHSPIAGTVLEGNMIIH
ncbi:MAG: imidazolonepropionase [Euryarchaeota archaeon]|nr:imidazolonepropionase [Euryarchaeota archaeon]DAC16356.1 MAG TPA: imidazolonepropionase [Candidatus Poseidoniales archaeon]